MRGVSNILRDLLCTSLFREWHLIAQNIAKCCIPVLTLERRGSVKHLVDQDSKGPPVYSAGMSAAFDDFRCDIFFGTDKGIGPEISDTRLGVDGGKGCGRIAASCRDHSRCTSGS